jgi:hypothetical protein
MAQYAITYAPNLSGGEPTNTTKTGSFRIGNLAGGVRAWNNVVPQTTTGTWFYASPLANINNAAPYVMAIPKPGAVPDQPQFFWSLVNGAPTLSDAAFVATCNFILRNYTTAGAVNPGSPADPTGCVAVVDCQTKFTTAGWFQSYGFTPPA